MNYKQEKELLKSIKETSNKVVRKGRKSNTKTPSAAHGHIANTADLNGHRVSFGNTVNAAVSSVIDRSASLLPNLMRRKE